MAIQLTDVRVAPKPVPTYQLLLRVMGEFREMPSLRLTADQAMRLWALDRDTCEAVIDELTEAQFLERDRSGRYCRKQPSY